MKMYRNPDNRLWQLISGQHVLYSGRRSPWQSPELLRDAARRERQLFEPNHDGDRARG